MVWSPGSLMRLPRDSSAALATFRGSTAGQPVVGDGFPPAVVRQTTAQPAARTLLRTFIRRAIITHIAQFKADNPSADVRLLTRDSGPVLTAHSLAIPCVVISEGWRLPPEPDDRDRQIQDLMRQLRELQAQEPEFQFSCELQSGERPNHVEIVYEAFQPLTATERDRVWENLLDLYPPTMVNGNRVAAQDISEYEERNHPAWRSACEEYLKVVHLIVQMERCPELTWRSRTPGRGQPQTSSLIYGHLETSVSPFRRVN